MKILKFRASGVLNSYRISFFRKYHKTFLAPPKTAIIGMLCNISLKSNKEFYELLSSDLVSIGVVIENIDGLTKDLWKYKSLNGKNRGSSVVRREKLFHATYQIYIKTEKEKLFYEFLNALKHPLNTPSLGMDDEMVKISDVVELCDITTKSREIHSVFSNINEKYKCNIMDIKVLSMPMKIPLPVSFVAFNNKGIRVSKTTTKKVFISEFYGCEVVFDDEIECFHDINLNKNVVFY
ncbi:CRISPR-associated protein Cas5 [Campylobacter geochelonis]|uniref:CRISPR-associated protein Cas5 n=1 Tax=Campylobacter geochelonis TaxID=1780362 RepID=UPI0007707689|nr:CRISPR-associated protein Cas5 [Campylobacter geochelonis]CZE47552.1 Uncharacterized protein predicted to be involved in DNA repair (RAMP superfamily) [Campylobacter geochelonis]CZE50214.1 Uncharacterized protein predicted to be involved in DNA repair (RAMP superfamily) [Campylobacter geochelonis]